MCYLYTGVRAVPLLENEIMISLPQGHYSHHKTWPVLKPQMNPRAEEDGQLRQIKGSWMHILSGMKLSTPSSCDWAEQRISS